MINSGTIYKYADQDVLNILLNENIKLIDKKYNKTITLSPIDRVDDNASRGTTILHYVTKK
ncbi:glycosyltransferase [Hafnia paralvei]|uniref:glycosyltransferase n=1 Tax=Hafnia paralvei TaxID=546367 RepID=UPI0020324673|nr:glycosyltransferase [Hafnia paralvei]